MGRYPKLTDDDVRAGPGRFDRAIDRIGRRAERSPDEVRNEVENFQETLNRKGHAVLGGMIN